MSNDPFAPLTRRQRRKRQLRRLADGLRRPSRPTCINPRREGPPNLVLVGVDTLRADHLGCYGYGRPTSPHLDRLGGRGSIFSRVTACAPWTLPSFASALTGVMPGLHGGYLTGDTRNMDTQPPRHLREDLPTLATHLGDHGYRTATFYSNQFIAFGLAESFDEHHYLNDEAAEVVRVALDWIRRHGDRPFFCFILLNDPHEPTTPAPRDLAPFLESATAGGAVATGPLLRGLARWGEPPAPQLGKASSADTPEIAAALALKLAVYDASIHQVDRAIGALNERLESWGLASTTVQAVFSDHGEEFLDHLDWARYWNHDPRDIRGIGHGHSLFQELLHVPWLAWGPGVPAGARSNDQVSLMDLPYTVLDWLGLPALPSPADVPADLEPLLRGRSLVGGTGTDHQRVILSEAMAYGPDLVAVRRGRWKLIAQRDGRPLALFDLQAEPAEYEDMRDRQPRILAELVAIAARWHASGLGAAGPDGGGSWSDMDAVIHQRLKDLGYAE